MFARYLERREEGFGRRAAAELVARVYGPHTPDEEAELIGTLEALEDRRNRENEDAESAETAVTIP